MSASIGQTFFAPDADRRSLARILKISGALGVIGIGTYAVMSEQGYIATDNAVISAYVVSIRTPIDGYVSGATRRIGSEIHRGDVIATVNNPRIDDQRLADLRAHLRRVQANQISTAIEREAFSRKRGELLARSDDHRRLMTERMAGMANSIERSSDAKVAAREEAHRDLQRKLALVRSGFVSRADVDRAQSAYDVAAKEVDSLHAQFMAARSGTASAKHGVLTDPGANDVSYSMQRADEIDIHITEVDHTLEQKPSNLSRKGFPGAVQI
jgi:multidrug resistance efflux pump